MKKPLPQAFLLALLFFSILSSAQVQRPKMKFGELTEKDFEPKTYSIDTSAEAIVLGHFGEVGYEASSQGGFSIVYKYHLRMRILKRSAFDAATISIPLYQGTMSNEEEVQRLEAFTCNLENGKIEKTKLDKKSIFKEKLNRRYMLQKFTMPNLKEGSILEIRYTVNSPYAQNIEPWTFQREYPTLWSEYTVSIPEIYEFVTLFQGYHPLAIEKSDTYERAFTITAPGGSERNEYFSYKPKVLERIWAMENVPALKPESFITTVQNHLARLSFQLARIKYPNAPYKEVMNNWMTAATDMMKHPDFGEELSSTSGWLKAEVKNITGNATSDLEAAKAIYAYVQKNITCETFYGVYKTMSLKKLMQNKTGNVADVNLLLTAMLSAQGFEAHPVLVSTRNNGVMSDIYPIEERMNYVIAQVVIGEKKYLLDASQSHLGFGMLPHKCYNGNARLINKLQPYIVNLSPDSIVEKKLTSIFVSPKGPGKMAGNITSTFGTMGSISLRAMMAKSTKEDYAKDIKKHFAENVTISEVEIDSISKIEEPIAVRYNLEMEIEDDVIYINPLFAEAQKDNPFKAAERYYPVEMDYAVNEMVVARIAIPEGYVIDELPKSTRVYLNENEGMFEYLFSKDADAVQVRSVLKLNKANFLPQDYATLRDFFAYVVKCHSEQIVFKKNKG